MGCNNFEDEALITRRWVGQKVNGMGKKFKDENKRNNNWKLFLFTIESCVCFQSSRVQKSMSAESTIEKLQIVAKEKETQKSEHKRR
jgi:hypothetical protein